MANFRLCAKNAIDYATMSASPAVSTSLPATNLQLPARGRVTRTTGTAAQDIKWTWGGDGYYLNFLILNRHNLESGATARLILYPNADWTGTPVYDSGSVAAYDYATLGDLDFGVDPLGKGAFDAWLGQRYTLFYFTRGLALSGKLTLTDTGNSAGYLEASRLYAGDYREVVVNPRAAALAWKDETELSRSAGGSLRSNGAITYRELELDLGSIDAADRPQLMDILRFAGKRLDVFAALFPGSTGEKERDYTLLGKFLELPDVVTEGSRSNLWQSRIRIGEV